MNGPNRTNQEMLEEFGLVAEEDLATLLGIGLSSLRQRPRDSLPEFIRAGRRRFYKEASVREWLGVPEAPPRAASSTAARHTGRDRQALRPSIAELRRIEDQLGRLLSSETVSDLGRRYVRLASFSVAQAVAALEAASG